MSLQGVTCAIVAPSAVGANGKLLFRELSLQACSITSLACS